MKPLIIYEIRQTREHREPQILYATNTAEKRDRRLAHLREIYPTRASIYSFDRKINL